MTAEIAILNKTAVALAADSAVTISAGSKEEKIFDSADKLFELSNVSPIGIMIYNGMSFVDTPIPTLIKQYRNSNSSTMSIEEAADSFLSYLNVYGREAPSEILDNNIKDIFRPVLERMHSRYNRKLQRLIIENSDIKDASSLQEAIRNILNEVILIFEKIYNHAGDAKFVGGVKVIIKEKERSLLRSVVEEFFPVLDNIIVNRLINLGILSLKKEIMSPSKTGIIVAGFGKDSVFPRLMSFEIDGMVCGKLKYIKTNEVTIDRLGAKARVLPFAQKEMVERFLYGLDEEIQDKIKTFCQRTISEITNNILDNISFVDSSSKKSLENTARSAEEEFLRGLREKAFEKMQEQSRAEIEDMVEFMPKPEMAKMAEALVNLTSIKRRVSRGMETVGGPIDVAIISQSEGFVWVKRKHYFGEELNRRYFDREKSKLTGGAK